MTFHRGFLIALAPALLALSLMTSDSAAAGEASPNNADSSCFTLDDRALDVVIGAVEGFQGQYVEISIDFLHDFNWPVAGFDFLIQYDASLLGFVKAVEGEFLTNCGWEFFTYRFATDGNCAVDGCPSGMLRIVAMAEGASGDLDNHPDCYDNDGTPEPGPGPNSTTATQLAQLTFLVSHDWTRLDCQLVPIRFVWHDCGDNSFSSVSGDTLHISNRVFDYAGDVGVPSEPIWAEITGFDNLMPTTTGAPSPECDLSDEFTLLRCANFYNGGVDIPCTDSVHSPAGDINCNSIPYEVADAVMFTNYFIDDTAAFQPHVDYSIAASEVNHDGMPLTVADLVYTIRVVIGDAFPYPKQAPVAGAYSVYEGVLTVADGLALGGAALVVKGEVHPELLAPGMDMIYRFDGDNTRIVVVPDVDGTTVTSFSGAFLGGIRGEILTIDLATPDGARVAAENVPVHYVLSQNYPNPFNASTTFEFALPEAGRFELAVFNIQGQAVHTYSGLAESPGVYRYTWDAGDLASGVYLYRLSTGEFTATKKLLLLK